MNGYTEEYMGLSTTPEGRWLYLGVGEGHGVVEGVLGSIHP
jgi:hypothetical protein